MVSGRRAGLIFSAQRDGRKQRQKCSPRIMALYDTLIAVDYSSTRADILLPLRAPRAGEHASTLVFLRRATHAPAYDTASTTGCAQPQDAATLMLDAHIQLATAPNSKLPITALSSLAYQHGSNSLHIHSLSVYWPADLPPICLCAYITILHPYLPHLSLPLPLLTLNRRPVERLHTHCPCRYRGIANRHGVQQRLLAGAPATTVLARYQTALRGQTTSPPCTRIGFLYYVL